MMRKSALAIGVAATAFAVPAIARDGDVYIGLDAGAIEVGETELEIPGVSSSTIDYDAGFDVDAVLGYDWGPIRTELEGSYKQVGSEDLSSATVGAPIPPQTINFAGADQSLASIMANALFDIGGEDGKVGFSIGGGFGRTWMELETDNTVLTGNLLEDDDDAWAYQGIAQVRLPVSDNIELGLKYRYFRTDEFEITDSLGRDIGYDLDSHSGLVSFIYNFGGAEAPPPPPPKL